MGWRADEGRYERMEYRTSGRSGLKLPLLTLGHWHNFGDDVPLDLQARIVTRAFDLGVTHFDLANNYGPPFGAAEINVGRILARELAPHRDEIVVSSKAGWDMWPGPYGFGGSRKYLVASLDNSLRSLGLDYVDVFYHHRPDPDTPIEETMGALDHIVRSGKALYAGVSSYGPEDTRRAHAILQEMGTPLTIHQPSYSLVNRWIEQRGLLDVCGELGIGVIGFTVLAQGLLTGKYLDGVPEGSRASLGAARDSFDPTTSDEVKRRLRGLADIASGRGQSLAQMAIAWALRDERMTSVTVGASSVEQMEQNVAALDNLAFTDDELAAIDELSTEAEGVDLWAGARDSRG